MDLYFLIQGEIVVYAYLVTLYMNPFTVMI